MVKSINLYKGSFGLNTVLDPQRLSQGSKDAPGIIELAQAVNVSIDDRGLCTLRNGSVEEVDGQFHSLFCAGGDCFVVQERTEDAAIMRVLSDYTLSGVRSGLTKGRRVAFAQDGADVFYSNGIQNGFIRDGASNAWPVHEYKGAEADLQFATSIPLASHLDFQQGGKILISVGEAIFANHSPFQYGLFELSHGNVAAFESNVTMIAAVKSGFFASDGRRTWFFRQLEGWYQYRQELVEDASAHEWSLAHEHVLLRDAGFDAPGFGRVWASAEGVCFGFDDGTFINLTKKKVKYPAGYTFCSCLVKDSTVIHTAW